MKPTCMNFIATSRKPFCSNRSMILPTNPRWTPSGLMAMKVRSVLEAIIMPARETQKEVSANRIQVSANSSHIKDKLLQTTN